MQVVVPVSCYYLNNIPITSAGNVTVSVANSYGSFTSVDLSACSNISVIKAASGGAGANSQGAGIPGIEGFKDELNTPYTVSYKSSGGGYSGSLIPTPNEAGPTTGLVRTTFGVNVFTAGRNGGSGSTTCGGGGGGAGGLGQNVTGSIGGNGGTGLYIRFDGTDRAVCGGGAGNGTTAAGTATFGGGNASFSGVGSAGSVNTGGGGGAGLTNGGSGGSGLVIIRYVVG